jgi:large subunit ribosomal protein L15
MATEPTDAPDTAEVPDASDAPAAEVKAVKPKKPKAAKPEPAPEPEADTGADLPASGAERTHVLKVHHLRPAPGANRPRIRVGRGEGSKGKTAGRGTKGTKARKNVPARLEGGQMPLHMRLPKLRGFKNPFRTEYEVVNVGRLAELFPEGGEVTVTELVERGAVRRGRLVKVLGDGEIAVKVDVFADAFSASAKDKIVAAGGSVSS